MKTPSRAEDDRATENNGNNRGNSGTGNSGAVSADSDEVGKAMGVERSPFDVEGEA